jgi:hypothetical protein
MQKLKGISSGQNKKSCIFHHESNKIGFAFYWFFCDFLRNLKESAKQQYYLRITFARKTLERFVTLQYGPRGAVAGAAGQFRRARRGSWPGKGWRGARGSPRTHSRVVSGRGGRRQGRGDTAGWRVPGARLRRGEDRGERVEGFGSFLRCLGSEGKSHLT